MAIKLLFDDVCEFNQGGIKQLYLSTVLDKSEPYYPINYYVSGSTVIDINEDMTFVKIDINEDAEVNQKRESDNQGKWYSKELKFTINKIDLQTNRFLNNVLFKMNIISSSGQTRPVNIKNYNTTAIFEDMNGNWWISGYDIPFKISVFEINTGAQGEDNKYDLTFISRSYDRIRKIVPIIDCEEIVYTQS